VSGPARTVLCIEDNEVNVRLIEAVLAARPAVRLVTAMQGSLGLELARRDRPHLILLDVHLPDTNGADLLQILRADPALRDIPVVVISADATAVQIDRLLATGAGEYLTKPIDIDQLLRILDRYLK
jgi:CheY-like chemotaxis protein